MEIGTLPCMKGITGYHWSLTLVYQHARAFEASVYMSLDLVLGYVFDVTVFAVHPRVTSLIGSAGIMVFSLLVAYKQYTQGG